MVDFNQISLFAPLFISIVLSLFLGLHVFLTNPGRRENKIICFLFLLHYLGHLFFLLQNYCPTVEAANLYTPPIAIATVWLNGLALLFAVTALYYQPFWENKKYINAFVATAVFFSIFTLLDYIPGVELFTNGASIKEGRYTIDYSSWSMLFVIWFSIIGLFIASFLLKGYRDGSPVVRKQIKILSVTVIMVSVTALFFNQHFIAEPLRFTDFVWVPLDILFAYFILKHKLVPIDMTLNVLSETIGEGFIMCDPEGIVFNINKRAIRILGLDCKENLLNKKWDIVVSSSPDALYNPNIINEMNQRLQEDPAQTLEIEILFSQPMERFIHIFTSALMDDAGRLLGRFFILTDLTSKRKSEEKLKLSEDKYRNLIESANDAIISTDYTGIIQSFNRKAEEVYGYSREEIIGKHLLTLTPESYEKEIKGMLGDFLKKGRSELTEKVIVVPAKRRDGREIIVEITFSSTQAEQGQLVTVIARDVTERKEMEEKLLRSEKLRALGELAGGVAHDFNNILSAILGRSQLLKMSLRDDSKKKGRNQTAELNKGLEIIERAASDGAETVRRIQEFSRRRDDDKDFASVNINDVVEHALEFTQVRWKDAAESKGLHIQINKDLSPLPQVAGSASELREVIINLINNSVEAMSQGGSITIKTFRDNNYVGIRIEDTGEGIPQGLKDLIFDPFFTTKGVQSTGLGLSVSYGIINRHRGSIAVESIDGKGTTFTIKLQIYEEKDDKKGTREDFKEKKEKIKEAAILVIEDEKEVSELLCDILTDSGHKIESASDGSKGIEIFQKGCFDLVFTDLGMPGLSGWQVAEEIKKMNSKTPVVLITGWEIRMGESELKEKGVDLMVNKPFRVEQISKSVQEALEVKRRLSSECA